MNSLTGSTGFDDTTVAGWFVLIKSWYASFLGLLPDRIQLLVWSLVDNFLWSRALNATVKIPIKFLGNFTV